MWIQGILDRRIASADRQGCPPLKPNAPAADMHRMIDDAHDPREGALVHERWRLVTKLDPLGEGRVWKADDTASEQTAHVVVKFAPPRVSAASDEQHESMLADFIHEAHVLDELDSSNVVRALAVHEGSSSEDEPDWPAYVVREFVDGETLAMALEARDGRPLDADDVRDVAESLLPILHDLHEQHVFCRALLPEHIVRRRVSGGGYDYVLVDFGAARSGSFERWAVRMRARQQTTRVLGMDRPVDRIPPAYRAPEYLDEDDPTWDARSDVWAVGILLWWLSTGTMPFDAPGQQVLHDIRMGRKPAYSMVAPPGAAWLGASLTDALAVDPADRPQTALELLDRITSAAPEHSSPRTWTDEDLIAMHEEVLDADRADVQLVFERWAKQFGANTTWGRVRAIYYQNRERITAMTEAAAAPQPELEFPTPAEDAQLVPVAPQAAVEAAAPAPAPAPVTAPVAEAVPAPEPAATPALEAVPEPAPEPAAEPASDALDYVAIVRNLVERRVSLEGERVAVEVKREALLGQLAQLDKDHERLNAEAKVIDDRLGGLAA